MNAEPPTSAGQSIESARDGFAQCVLAPLARVARSARRRAIVGGLSATGAILVALCVGQFTIDRLLVLGVGPRLVLLAAVVALAARWFSRRAAWAFAARPGPGHIAAVLERRHPGLHDRLVSAVCFAGDEPLDAETSPAMAAMVMRQAAADLAAIDPRQVLERPRLRNSLVLGAAAATLVVSASLAARPTVTAFIARNWMLRDVPWPSNVRLELEGFASGEIRWPIGDDFALTATAHGVVPRGIAVECVGADGKSRVREMAMRGDRQFILDYGPLDASLRLRLLLRRFGVDEATPWYSVVGVQRPAIRDLRLEVSPPAYAQLDALALPGGTASAEVLRGSRVAIAATTNKPVKTAALRGGADEAIEAQITDGVRLAARFEPTRSGNYSFDLRDFDGLNDLRPVTIALRLKSDPPPKAKLTIPGAGDAVAPGAVLSLAVSAEDNLGLRDVNLVSQVTRGDALRQDGAADAGRQPAELDDADESAGNADRPDDPDQPVEPPPAASAAIASGDGVAEPPITSSLTGLEPRQTKFDVEHAVPLLPMTLRPGDQISLLVEARDFQPDAPGDVTATTQPPAQPATPPGLGRSAAVTLRIVTPEELQAELGRRESEWRREFEMLIKMQEQIRTRVLNLNDEAAAQAGSTQFSAQYLSEQRAQRQVAVRMQTIRRQFEQILAELRTSRLDSPTARRRLGGGVISPMGRLISESMPAVAEQLERLAAAAGPENADTVEQGLGEILEVMYSVLANMLKWEGYNEAVTLLRDIIRLHEDVTRQTQSALEAEIERLLGGRPTSQPSPQRPPDDR